MSKRRRANAAPVVLPSIPTEEDDGQDDFECKSVMLAEPIAGRDLLEICTALAAKGSWQVGGTLAGMQVLKVWAC